MIVDPTVGDVMHAARRTYYDFYYKLIQLGWEIEEFSPACRIYEDSKDNKNYLSMQDLEKITKPDIIASWDFGVVKKFLPEGKTKHTPFVVFGGDYHAIPDTEWYTNFDFVVQRGPYETEFGVQSVWLPLSIDDDFYPSEEKRENKIVFIGNVSGNMYKERRNVIELLKKTGIFVDRGIVGVNSYPAEVRRYVGGFTCTGPIPLRQPLAKHFEYGASGTAVLTPRFDYSERLFGYKQCYFEFKENCSDLVEVAKEIINNKDKVKEVTKNMLTTINNLHRDKHRILELDLILKALINGDPIPRKWGM